MHVTLLGNYLPDEQESMQRYLALLQDQLTRKGYDVAVLRPEPCFGRLKRSGHGLGKWLGYLDKFILFPRILRRHVWQLRETHGRDFLVHVCDHSNAMYTHWLRDVPHLVTCHDVLAIQSAQGLIPEHKTGWTGRLLQAWILSGLRWAAYVVCVSDQTRKDLLSLAPELGSRSVTIENALPYPFSPMPREQALQQLSPLSAPLKPETDPFLLHVGGNQWYKNREGVIRIFAHLCTSTPETSGSLKLVMAGKRPTENMLRLVSHAKIEDRVIFLDSVNDEQLRALYSLAEMLVFPSLREGFGWPVIEAEACGCPVVTSDRAPMSQIAGPAALLANPGDIPAFATRIQQLLAESPELRRRRKVEARQHASHYNPESCLQSLLLVYGKLAGQTNGESL